MSDESKDSGMGGVEPRIKALFSPESPMTRCPKCTVNGQVNCPEHRTPAPEAGPSLYEAFGYERIPAAPAPRDTGGDVGPADHLDGLVAYAIPTPSLLDFGKARALIPSHAQAALNAQAAALVAIARREESEKWPKIVGRYLALYGLGGERYTEKDEECMAELVEHLREAKESLDEQSEARDDHR